MCGQLRPIRVSFALAVLVLVISGCGYGGNGQTTQTRTPNASAAPAATVGPLAGAEIEKPALSLLAPSTWKPPVVLDDHRLVLSPDGSTGTQPEDGPFLFIVVDALQVFRSQVAFREDFTDPIQQLDALLNSINRDSARFSTPAAYDSAKYPGAMTRGYERGNVLTIVLLRSENNRWIYVGAQAIERLFPYYESAVFKPVTDSLALR